MAIGSEPEVGINFAVWKDMSEKDREAWFAYMRENWGEYLQAGYATLVHDKRDNPYYGERDGYYKRCLDSHIERGF